MNDMKNNGVTKTNMKKDVIFGCFLAFIAFIQPAFSADSDMRITEIAAAPISAEEWVEIYNRGSADVNVSGWKFWESATNHGLSLIQGSTTIPAGGYAVICNNETSFLAANPGFSGTLIDASWSSLSTTGEEIGLKTSALTAIEIFTYPATTAGTLERVNGDWADYTSANWKQSQVAKGTPAKVNDDYWFHFYTNEPSNSKNIDIPLVNLIDSATTRIYAAIYDLTLQNVCTGLVKAKARGVDVKVVCEFDNYNPNFTYLENNGIVVIKDNSTSYDMHNKFFVIDDKVWTGSFNPTVNDRSNNANNAIWIRDNSLANTFTDEFNQMFNGSFHNAKTVDANHIFTVANQPVKAWFGPKDNLEQKVNTEIDSALHTLNFGIFTFTLPSVAAKIDQARVQGVNVQGICDAAQAASVYAQYQPLKDSGVNIRKDDYNTNPGFFHWKGFVADYADPTSDPTVVIGSANWTNKALPVAGGGNDENLLFVISYDLANRYYVAWKNDWDKHTQAPASPAGHIVINQFASRGASSASDEFVELYNPSAANISIANWKLQYKSSTGATWSDRVTFPAGTVINAGKFRLTANSAGYTAPASGVTPDNWWSVTSGSADDGHFRVISDTGSVVDLVGYGTTADSPEGASPAPSQGTTANGKSVKRLTDGGDSNNNGADFSVITARTPRNSSN